MSTYVRSTAAAIFGIIGLFCAACTPVAGAPPAPGTNEEMKPAAITGAGLNLPRIPWEGGPDYWKSFTNADAAGWDEPSFFPVAIWYNGISSDEEVRFDKEHGINTYMGMDSSTPYSIFERNGVYWIGGKLNESFTPSGTNWVGAFLDDEVDGRFTPEDGREHLQRLADAAPAGLFKYANFTQMVISQYMPATDAQAFVNGYTDAVSLDMYWYTIPYCSLEPYQNTHLVPVDKATCRTASSYGKTMEALRQQDAADGKLQPLWQFVENLNGGPGEGPFVANISPGQLEGAVMSSVINEARGIIYFNQSLSGPCGGGSVLRLAQVTAEYCGAPQIEGMKNINSQIHEMAPVLNTQSYDYSFGEGLDTMLKTYDGAAYIFAMATGESVPGSRHFSLPPDIKADTVEVLFEGRSLPVDGRGRFSDSFAHESAYHVYKVKL
jgi:hypothetical protein